MSIQTEFHITKNDFNLDINIIIPSEGITAIFGPSGSGKTTLLRAIAGLDQHKGSVVKIKNDIWQENKLFIPPHQRSIGFVFQEDSLFPHLNVSKNIEYGYKRASKNSSQISIQQITQILKINHLLERLPFQLSGGEKQRVGIARALAASPKLLLMDEPLASLDINLKREILSYISRIHREFKTPIIYVSHSPTEIAYLSHHLIILDSAHIVASGPTQELLTRIDLPLALDQDASAVIEAKVRQHDDKYKLTHLQFNNNEIKITRNSAKVGEIIRLRILARDVSLSLTYPSQTSILNIFPATVREMTNLPSSQVLLQLRIGEASILSRISLKSAMELQLKPGVKVYAQVKSVALY